MKMLKKCLVTNAFVAIAGSLAALPVNAQVVTVPSGTVACDWSTSTTMALPADGIIYCTTLIVEAGVTVTFTKNSLNTPVYVLASDTVTVNGTIDVSAQAESPNITTLGGPGGFDGGTRGFGGPAGPGRGPGGGAPGDSSGSVATTAGGGGYGSIASNGFQGNGVMYGSALEVPLVGGSGGGGTTGSPGANGGGGGGAILIASNASVAINSGGAVLARGGRGRDAFLVGSGGAVRIVAPHVSGGGLVDVSGGSDFAIGGYGRIRIDTLHRGEVAYNLNPATAVSVGSFMVAFPSTVPRIDIVQVGSTPIGGGAQTDVILPSDSSPTENIVVRVQDFGTGTAQVFVRLEPASGIATVIGPVSVVNNNPTSISATFQVNNPTHVLVWGTPQ